MEKLYNLKVEKVSQVVLVVKKTCLLMQETFDIWVRKIPWRRSQQPTAVFLPGQRSLVGYGL